MSRRYWWTNQTTNYATEIVAGRLWASLNANGTMIVGRRSLLELAPGDIVFHYNKHTVRAMSRVTIAAHPASRPDAYPKRSEMEPDEGWAAFVETIDTNLLIDGHDVANLLPHSTATLDKYGWVNRRYLSELTEEDAIALTRFAGVKLPVPDTLAGRPWDEVVDPGSPTDGKRWSTYRREQNELRDRLLGGKADGICALCRETWPAELLVAAHIKPRRDCTEIERRDYANVAMLLCALGCDVLFEWGFVVVNSNGAIREGRGPGHPALRARVNQLAGGLCVMHTPSSAPYFAARTASVSARK